MAGITNKRQYHYYQDIYDKWLRDGDIDGAEYRRLSDGLWSDAQHLYRNVSESA